MKNTLCIYHGNCADGFTSAWVVRRALGADTEFYPGIYGQPPPLENIRGKDVILVDYSYKRPIMEQIITEANSVLILDHHKTAEEDLKDLAGANVVFDMNRSGARIAWDHFFPNEAPPPLLLVVEDRDLWRFSIPNAREIQAALFSYEYTFENWDQLMSDDLEFLVSEGKVIERKHFKDIRELLEVTKTRMLIGGYVVPVANMPYTFGSDVGNILAKGEPFAGYYYDTPKGRVFGLRSAEDGLDVSEIAKLYGGGGHKHASGFTVSFEVADTFMIDGK